MRASCALLAIAAGCGYSSEYLVPNDGRPRAVWVEDHVAVEPAGAPLPPACMQQLAWLSRTTTLRLASGDELRLTPPAIPPGAVAFAIVVAPEVWVPRYWGPRIVAPAPGVAPLLPHPPLFLPPPRLHAPVAAGGRVLDGAARVGGGGGGGDGRAAEILAAIALVVLPAVAIGLAASRPEDDKENADAIDQVNAYNDLLRSGGSACAVAGPAS